LFKDKSLRGETSRDSPELGLDVHQATIVVAVTDSTGKLIMESILETEAATILQFFAGFPFIDREINLRIRRREKNVLDTPFYRSGV
jgi:hypothetical protein